MRTISGHIRSTLLGLSAAETTCARRGFRGGTLQMRERLDAVGAAFLTGYRSVLVEDTIQSLATRLNGVALELRGFAFEGAGMALALLDGLTPWNRKRVKCFLDGPGDPHTYMIHVGVGWVWARMPFNFRPAQKALDPLLRWLAFDGWGFHEGYFRWREYASGRLAPNVLSEIERSVFDQGLGRSFWFVNCGNPELISQMIENLPASRQADLWSGVGLSSTYAGIVEESALRALRRNCGQHWPQLAQGCAFAVKARQRAGNLTDYSQLAAKVLCGMSVEEAAAVCDTTLENLPECSAEPAYAVWRKRIQHHIQQHQLKPQEA